MKDGVLEIVKRLMMTFKRSGRTGPISFPAYERKTIKALDTNFLWDSGIYMC
jgi:hypothetical protein